MINPLFLTPPGGTVESSPFPQPVPGSHWRTCKVSIQYLENCANACRIYVCWVINPLFLSHTGTVESSTPSRPVPESRWRICKVSTLCFENCANACWIYVFRVINPLFLSPTRYRRILNPSTTCPGESVTYLWSFNSVSWKLCECTSNLRFFEWLTLYFWAPRGTVESITSPQPVPENRWRTCKVSALYLENCANAGTILFINIYGKLYLCYVAYVYNREIVSLIGNQRVGIFPQKSEILFYLSLALIWCQNFQDWTIPVGGDTWPSCTSERRIIIIRMIIIIITRMT